jgi:hypothetical protein
MRHGGAKGLVMCYYDPAPECETHLQVPVPALRGVRVVRVHPDHPPAVRDGFRDTVCLAVR